LRWLQKQDDDEDIKLRTTAGREFQAAGPQTAKLTDSRTLLSGSSFLNTRLKSSHLTIFISPEHL